jgi:hypothetical protein
MSDQQGVIHNERIFQNCGQWYFNTREGIEGPYQDPMQAKQKLEVYLEIFAGLDLAERTIPGVSPMPSRKQAFLPAHMQWR